MSEVQKLVDAGKFQEAAILAKVEAINSLQMAALICTKMGDPYSIYLAQKCVELDPDNARLWGNLSYFLGLEMQCDEAMQAIDKALELSPCPDFYCNKAILLGSQRRVEEAIGYYEKAIAMDDKPNPTLLFNLGCMYMLVGRYKEGLPLLEARFGYDPELVFFMKRYSAPDWKGKELTGKRVLIFSEQGIGDVLQHIRYIPMLRPAYLIAELQECLVPLVSDYFDEVVGRSDNYRLEDDPQLPEHDYVISFASLPYLLDPELKNIPPAPFLFGEKVEQLDQSKINIGVAWAGNGINTNDINRSCAAKELLPLAQIPGVQLSSLQKGQLKRNWNGRIVDLSEGQDQLGLIDRTAEFTDMKKTADFIEGLDLVVTVCTSIAHLAGAMGKLTFLALGFCHDQRWPLSGSETHWYGGTRIFRQKSQGDWSGVFGEIAKEIKKARISPGP